MLHTLVNDLLPFMARSLAGKNLAKKCWETTQTAFNKVYLPAERRRRPIYNAGRAFLQLRMFGALRGSIHPNIRHQGLTTVLVNLYCPNKMPKTGWLLTVL